MMPCSDGNYNQPSVHYIRDPAVEARCHQLARLLCEACSLIPYSKMLESGSVQLRAWNKAHEAEDNARKAEEAAQKELEKIRSAALKKLTKDERKALGV